MDDLLCERIAEETTCLHCKSDIDGNCGWFPCEKIEETKDLLLKLNVWNNYILAKKKIHIHFYTENIAACKKKLARPRRKLEEKLRKDCSFCETMLEAAEIPVE